MGNCLRSGSPSNDPSHNFISNSNRSNSGTSNHHYNNKPTVLSATSSSGGGKSQFSEAVSEGDESINPNGDILEVPCLKVFAFADLKAATKNFREDTLLGEGGFGKVYRGWIDEKSVAPSKFGSGMIMAIKKLNPESFQGFNEWQSEVHFLGRLSHPNLVKLLGYCWEDRELLLVYEFMHKGSLENHLFPRKPTIEPLSWDLRLKIAIGAAQGLAFLHASEKQIIYRDFKASNILLDENYNAKISDFGLAKPGPSGGNSHVTTEVMGTFGYAAPEYIATGHLYVKSDVYGFGVVLLEMMTGLRAFDRGRPDGQRNLVDWLKPSLSHKKMLKTIWDKRMDGHCSPKAMLQVAKITLRCLERDPRSRPNMKEVVEVLKQIEMMKDTPEGSKSPSGSAHSSSTSHRRDQRQQRARNRSPLRSKAA